VCTVVIHIEVNVEVGGHVRLDGMHGSEASRSDCGPHPQTRCCPPCSGPSVDATLAQAIRGRERAPNQTQNTGPTGSGSIHAPASALCHEDEGEATARRNVSILKCACGSVRTPFTISLWPGIFQPRITVPAAQAWQLPKRFRIRPVLPELRCSTQG